MSIQRVRAYFPVRSLDVRVPQRIKGITGHAVCNLRLLREEPTASLPGTALVLLDAVDDRDGRSLVISTTTTEGFGDAAASTREAEAAQRGRVQAASAASLGCLQPLLDSSKLNLKSRGYELLAMVRRKAEKDNRD